MTLDKLKSILIWTVSVFSPALITLISTIAQVYKFDLNTYVVVISGLTTFIGALVGWHNSISNK